MDYKECIVRGQTNIFYCISLLLMTPIAEPDQRQGSLLQKHDEVAAGFSDLHTYLCSPGGHHQHQIP